MICRVIKKNIALHNRRSRHNTGENYIKNVCEVI